MFLFKDQTHEQVLDYINDRYPISLKKNQDLVDRVHNRYPFITKTEVALIIKATFNSIRDLLILGKTLNIGDLFTDCKLNFFTYRGKKDTYPGLSVRLTTPKDLK